MQPTLEQTLQELHEQLASTQDLQDHQLALLRNTLAEIQTKLHSKTTDSPSLAAQLTESMEQIQGSHPVLTNTIARVADLLSQVGI